MPESQSIRVSVVYALPDSLFQRHLRLADGNTVADAIFASGLAEVFPDAVKPEVRCGIFSQATNADTVLHDGDRVEVYRPLVIDPKQARRKRATRT